MNMEEIARRFAELEARITSHGLQAEAAKTEAQSAKEETRIARGEAQAARAETLAAHERVRAAEAEAATLRAAAQGSGVAAVDALVGEGAAEAGEGAASIPAKLAFPMRPIKSPTTDDASCFLDDPFMALVHEPTTLPVDASLSTAFGALLKIAGGARGMGVERNFYPLATAHLPSFARAVGEPSGDMTAEALFSPSALATPVWSFPTGCKPELHARAASGDKGGSGDGGASPTQPTLCPAFNGELKSAGDGRALEQASLYTVLDLIRVFFPVEPASTTRKSSAAAAVSAAHRQRLFYTRPPLGYALVAYPFLGQVWVVECLGKMSFSPYSQPFLLGSTQHKEVMATLPQPPFEPPLVLDLTVVQPWRTVPGKRAELSSWCTHGGVFRKLVRGDARSGAGFASMHAAYARLAVVLPHAPPHLHLPTSLGLLFGLHCVLVESVPVVVGRAALEEEELHTIGSPLLLSVARAIAWLAAQRVIYTDVRGPNVMVDKSGVAWLVDYDDCLVVGEPVGSLEAFKVAMAACPFSKMPDSFAASLCEGAETAFERALAQAFEELAVGGGTACIEP